MLIDYMRVSGMDIQVGNVQRIALLAAGVAPTRLYEDHASGKRAFGPGLDACLKSLHLGDTLAGGCMKLSLDVSCARARHGGRPFTVNEGQLRKAQAAMARSETSVAELCAQLGISRQTLHRHVAPQGRLRPDGKKLLCREQAIRKQAGRPGAEPGLQNG